MPPIARYDVPVNQTGNQTIKHGISPAYEYREGVFIR